MRIHGSRFIGLISVAGLVTSALFGSTHASRAAGFIVNTLTDANNGSCATICTLRDAMLLAPSGSTITFSLSGTIALGSTLPIVTSQLIIDGAGQTVVLDGGGNVSLMSVNSSGNLSLNAVTLRNGKSSSGGAMNNSGTLNITNSTFSGNSASFGGAIVNMGVGKSNIANSTFANNSAASGGAALFNYNGTMNITNSIIFGNAGSSGGAVYNDYGTLVLNNSLISTNNGGDCSNNAGQMSGGHNLSNGTCPGTLAAATNTAAVLAYNGGLTQTIALLAGSNAIDAIPTGSCIFTSSGINPLFSNAAPITTDQRDITRPQGSACDIGAYEYIFPGSVSMTPTASNTPTVTFTLTPTLTATSSATPTATSTAIPPNRDSIGIYRAGTFYLRLHNNQGFADFTVGFNPPGTNLPVVGDWAGIGYDTMGVFNKTTASFTLCTANNTALCAINANQIGFTLGNPGDTPLAGRWIINASHAGAGVYRSGNGVLYLKNGLSTGFADDAMVMGLPGDAGIAGDWTGKGFDSPGIYRPSVIGFFLSNRVTSGSVYGDITLTYGSASDLPITGDWIAQGHDGVGMFRPTNGFVYLKNTLTSGFADNAFFYGSAGDQPVAGHWQAIYPPIPAAPVLIAKTAIPSAGSISVSGDNRIGG